ncbi:hypothetical protein JTE90_024606 [Oedothorax gibbosus]|uniref:Uncharacterized protein n=1 Tax=Oedothorax gibbosus TaxID=931172 RepID=A0AAV6U0E1_9ARAC|nr:hypothetical protein JTE90_024606 [Oedothorax gibbosus]
MEYFTLKQLRIIKTCNLYLSYAVTGLCLTVIGASVLDLQQVVKTDTKSIAFVFVARSAGYLIGLLFGAPILDKTVRKLLVMTILNFIIAVTMFAVPLSRSIEILFGWMTLNGIAIGAISTALNTYCLNLWGKGSGAIFQAQTFAFGIGCLVAPLFVAPFQRHDISTEETTNYSSAFSNINGLSTSKDVFQNSFSSFTFNASQNFSGTSLLVDSLTNTYSTSSFIDFLHQITLNGGKETLLNTSSTSRPSVSPYISKLSNVTNSPFNLSEIYGSNDTFRNAYDDLGSFTIPQIFYGYAIIGIISSLVTFLFLIVYIISPLDATGRNSGQDEVIEQSKTFIGVVVLLTFLLLFVELGVQVSYGLAVSVYTVKGPLRQSNRVGSYMSSMYWTAFTISRFFAIFYVLKFSNLSLILNCQFVTSVGAVVFLFSQAQAEWTLWLATFLIGFGISPFFSTAIAWIDQYINITNKFVALFMLGDVFGEMVGPFVIIRFIEEAPGALSYMVAASCVLSLPLILGMYLLLRNKPRKYQKKDGVSNNNCDVNLDNEVYI